VNKLVPVTSLLWALCKFRVYDYNYDYDSCTGTLHVNGVEPIQMQVKAVHVSP